jgi:hypothetical protein
MKSPGTPCVLTNADGRRCNVDALSGFQLGYVVTESTRLCLRVYPVGLAAAE